MGLVWISSSNEFLAIDKITFEPVIKLWKEPFGGWCWVLIKDNIFLSCADKPLERIKRKAVQSAKQK